MTTLRTWSTLLMLMLAVSGCRSPHAADPLGLENGSMLSGLVPRTGSPARGPAARRGAAAGGDPFIQSTAQGPSAPTGRASISDTFGEDNDRDALTSRGAASVAAQPMGNRTAGVIPPDGRSSQVGGVQGEAVVEAAMFDSRSSSSVMDEAAVRQRLESLEWELQFTDDHDAQDQLALEIARLRKQLSRSNR
jgi:hypothetical protein